MLVAAIDSFGYNFFLLLHLLFVVVAFSPAFVWPILNRLRRTDANSGAGNAVGRIVDPMMHGGSLVLAGLFGIILVLMSDSVIEFSQSWISIAFVLWFLMLGVFFAGLIPAQRQIVEGKPEGDTRLAMCYGGMHLLLLLQIIVMVWKPGL
ncbi:MAG TPA: hypothetical protein VFN21_01660 [Acidimicrobiales bacterium]|nr:hypothetical protein [Acidimicrobiales bacterium]